jgi:hypothetical protein
MDRAATAILLAQPHRMTEAAERLEKARTALRDAVLKLERVAG